VDTDVLIEILDRRSVKGEKALEKLVESGESVCITVINLHEVLYGLIDTLPLNKVRGFLALKL